jgi:signal peptidase II
MKNKKLQVVFLSALFVILLDQLSKLAVTRHLKLNESIPVIDNIFHITYITNTGSVFGILKGWQLPLIFFTLIVIGFVLFSIDKIKEKQRTLQVFVGFILGAAIGNLIDRLAFGYVIDFLDFRIWPIFNIADSFITLSVIFLVVYFWKK